MLRKDAKQAPMEQPLTANKLCFTPGAPNASTDDQLYVQHPRCRHAAKREQELTAHVSLLTYSDPTCMPGALISLRISLSVAYAELANS